MILNLDYFLFIYVLSLKFEKFHSSKGTWVKRFSIKFR